MIRAKRAQPSLNDGFRTVSSVSGELGVSPSTLRTWERRYGLGPIKREAGARRRYQPEDVERLRAMIGHVRAGLPAAEAAKRALSEEALPTQPGPANASQLQDIAQGEDYPRLEEALEAAVAAHGLVHTWSRFVEPTLKNLRANPGGDPVGGAPSHMLVNAFQRVCRSVYLSRPMSALVGVERVALISDARHETAAQVIGVTLSWHGCDVRILPSEDYGGLDASDRFREYVRAGVPALTIILGTETTRAADLVDRYGVPTILVGPRAPDVHNALVQRVRTVAACVAEAVALLRGHAAPDQTTDWDPVIP